MPVEPYTAEALALAPNRYAAAGDAVLPGTVRAADVGPDDVLVLRALGLGDALTGIAPLRGLRRLFPDHRLVLAAPAALGSWLTRLGVVDATLPTPGLVALAGLPGGHVAVDLHGRGPASQRLLADTRPSRLIAFDCPEVGHAGPRWARDEHEVHRWCRVVSDAGGPCSPADLRLRSRAEAARSRRTDSPIIVHPGAAAGSRRWPAERWRQVVAALVTQDYPVRVTGSADERELAACVAGKTGVRSGVVQNVAGCLDLPGLADLVAGAALVVSGDTGMGHLATALATPSVLLFGPVPPRWWGPAIDDDLHRVLWHGDPDAAAWGDPHGESVDPRLAGITVTEVLDAIADLLDQSTASGADLD